MRSNLKWPTWFENFYNYLGRNICGTSQVHNNFIFNWLALHTATFLCWSLTFYCIMIINWWRSILEHCLIKSVTDFKVILNCENWQSINFLVFLFIWFFWSFVNTDFWYQCEVSFSSGKRCCSIYEKERVCILSPNLRYWYWWHHSLVNPLTSKSD